MSLIKYLKALADDTRLRLVHVLSLHELSVNELVNILEMGQSRISRHLKILSEAGLLTSRRDGLWVFYSTTSTGPAHDFLNTLTPFWQDTHQADANMSLKIMEERVLKTKHFFNSIAEHWDTLNREILGDFDLAQTIYDLMPTCGVAADLGCGTGLILEKMQPKAQALIGVDGSPRMLELARRRFKPEDDIKISLRIGDLLHLPLRDSETDFACINMVLHHLSQPESALLETRRVLTPGGLLTLIDFDKHSQEQMRTNYNDLWLGFDLDTLDNLLQTSGFKVLIKRKQAVQQALHLNIILAQKLETL